MGDTILEKYEERKAELRTVNEIVLGLCGLFVLLVLFDQSRIRNINF